MVNDGPKINIDIPEEDARLLFDCALKQNPTVKSIHVSQLGRVGYSGANLFRAYFDEKKRGYPFVVKIDSRKNITKEVSAINRVKIYFPDALSGFERCYYKGKGAIVYLLFASVEGDGEAEVVELKDVVYDLSKDNAEILESFDSLYKTSCVVAHTSGQSKGVNIKHQYKRYLRDRKADDLITAVLENKKGITPFKFLGADVIDPRSFLDSGFRAPLRCILSAVHGDLHPNNVVFGHDGKPKLIDFAWGHQSAHVLKDFVLMENSLRFLLFPPYVNLELQQKVDEALLNEDGYDRISEMVGDSNLVQHYVRLAGIIEIIRSYARIVGGSEYDFDEYLAAQFLMLYGLLKYPGYHFHVGLRALGMIANRLACSRFGF